MVPPAEVGAAGPASSTLQHFTSRPSAALLSSIAFTFDGRVVVFCVASTFAVGVLFAIDHFGPYSFERTWPALIILIGLRLLWAAI